MSTAARHRHGYFEARPSDVVDAQLVIVDVRAAEEIAVEQIHGARAYSATQALAGEFPLAPDAPFALVCSNGTLSRDVAKALATHGFTEVRLMVGGMRRWLAEERPVARQSSVRDLSA